MQLLWEARALSGVDEGPIEGKGLLCKGPLTFENRIKLSAPSLLPGSRSFAEVTFTLFLGHSQVGLSHTHSSLVSCIPTFSCCFGAALSLSLLVFHRLTLKFSFTCVLPCIRPKPLLPLVSWGSFVPLSLVNKWRWVND